MNRPVVERSREPPGNAPDGLQSRRDDSDEHDSSEDSADPLTYTSNP